MTETLTISLFGEFLPIQVIYEGKTKRCLPKYTFPASFDATFSENHWSNTEKSLSFFNKIVFSHFKNVLKAKGYPDEQGVQCSGCREKTLSSNGFLLILNFQNFSKFFPSPLHQIFL